MPLLEVTEWSELDHRRARTLRFFGSSTRRNIGGVVVRATDSGAVMIGDNALTKEQANEFVRAVGQAIAAQGAWLDHVSGRTRYITRSDGDRWLCTHMGHTGELRPYRPKNKRSSRRTCDRCEKDSALLWIAKRKAWRFDPALCEPCLRCCEGVRQGIRLVGKPGALLDGGGG